MNYSQTTCGMCDGRGIIMAPQMTSSPNAPEKRSTIRAFRCACHSGLRFLGVQAADTEVERHGVEQVQESFRRTAAWYKGIGLDFENDPEETLLEGARKRFREYKNEKLFRDAKPAKSFA